MSLISSLIRKTTLPWYWKRTNEHRQLDYLDDFQKYDKMSAYDLAKIQRAAFDKMITHIYNNCPYYNKIFRKLGITPVDIGSFADLRQFPVLTKELIRENMNDILAENYSQSRRDKSSTGGSTGEPLTFWRDYECRDKKQAMHLNFKRWYGYLPGDKQVYFWGALQDFDQKQTLKSRLARSLATRSWFITSQDIESANFARTVKMIRRLKPKLVLAYPNIIYTFARKVVQKKLHLKFDTIVCSAEQFFDYQREFLIETFDAQVFEKYGSREIGTIASECHKHRGMHYFLPGLYLETVDQNGNPAGAEMGKLLVTDLWNFAMPLIRYEVGDLVRLDHSDCPCGCKLPRIAKVAGRVVDTIVKPNGEMIAGQALIKVIRKSEVPYKTQIIQKKPDHFEIRYESQTEMAEDKKNYIRSSYAEIFGQAVHIDFLRVDKIEREKSGKFRYIKSEIESPYSTKIEAP